MAHSLLALGSNLGDRHSILSQACAAVAKLPGCQLLARSQWHATVPIGGAAGQGEFLNGAVLLETSLAPQQLATFLRQTENLLGRHRVVRWDARSIDIDLLLYDAEIIETDELIVPHPRMTFRKFVLAPAAEIAGAMVHPSSGWTIARLLTHLRDSPRFVVVTSDTEGPAECLVSYLSRHLLCPVLRDADKSLAKASGSPSGARVEFPTTSASGPPSIAALSPETLGILAKSLLTQKDIVRPALVIAMESRKSPPSPTATDWLDLPALGPLARITAADPATIAQEAEAAVCCIWPDVLRSEKN